MNNKTTSNKKKYFVLGLITFLIGLSCIVGYFISEDKTEEIDNLTYVEGQLDYSYSPWIYKYRYWSLRRRRRFRKKHFELFLEEDHVRYTSGSFVMSNLYEEPFYDLIQDYPRPSARIGYLNTDNPYVKDVYSIEIDHLQLINIDGVKNDMKQQKLVLIIVGSILSLLSLIFFFIYFKK